MTDQVVAWVGLGSNLGDSEKNIIDALTSLSVSPEVSLEQWSSLYSTPPWGDQDQPDFINAVASVQTSLSAEGLLRYLQSIELRFGRTRSKRRWGPRTLDLDILMYAQQVINLDHLIVPHPRMVERAFVMIPLAEVASGLNIPGQGLVKDCLMNVETEGVTRLYRPRLVSGSGPA